MVLRSNDLLDQGYDLTSIAVECNEARSRLVAIRKKFNDARSAAYSLPTGIGQTPFRYLSMIPPAPTTSSAVSTNLIDQRIKAIGDIGWIPTLASDSETETFCSALAWMKHIKAHSNGSTMAALSTKYLFMLTSIEHIYVSKS